jgi:2'-5' RNA ligase
VTGPQPPAAVGPAAVEPAAVEPHRSAIVIPVELSASLEAARLSGDPVAALGVPAHITLLFPFLEPRVIDAATETALAAVIGRERAFEFTLVEVRSFPPGEASAGTVFLAPEPAAPFVRLTRAIWAHWPDHPPYGGAFDTVVPHLTLAEAASRQAEIEAIARADLPMRRRAEEAWLLVEGDGGRWSHRGTFRLG